MWIINWLNGQAQSIMVSDRKSIWRLVTSNVLKGSILGPVLLDISINDVDDGAKYTLSKSVHDTKLRRVPDTVVAHAANQGNLNRLEIWADRNLTKFLKRNSKNLHWEEQSQAPGHAGGHTA